jgi:hypothetical protein
MEWLGPCRTPKSLVGRGTIPLHENRFFPGPVRDGNWFTSPVIQARFTLGVRANVQPKSSIPIGAKVENQPQGLYTRSQG